jgi:hypothetical protein
MTAIQLTALVLAYLVIALVLLTEVVIAARFLFVAAVLVLTGCATDEKVVYRTQIVEKPVPVPCGVEIPKECRGPFAVDRVGEADDPVTQARAIRAELEQRRACQVTLTAAVGGCNVPGR